MKKIIKNLILFSFMFFIFVSCTKKKNEEIISKDEKIAEFSLKHFSKNYSITLIGESAEITENKNTKISAPNLSLKTDKEIIEIKTDKEGKGEIKIDPENKKLKEIMITGKVIILYKDKTTENVTMEITCGKVSYIDEKREMIFEEKPLIKRGKNKFSGEKVIYNIDNNTIEIKGNVHVEIVPEEKVSK